MIQIKIEDEDSLILWDFLSAMRDNDKISATINDETNRVLDDLDEALYKQVDEYIINNKKDDKNWNRRT